MSTAYYQTVDQLEKMRVDPDYLQGWVGGYLGNPQRRFTRNGDGKNAHVIRKIFSNNSDTK